MPISLPCILRFSRSSMVVSSRPSNMIESAFTCALTGRRPITDSMDTLLPLPDSPTMPTDSP